jgi:hypothetical protein
MNRRNTRSFYLENVSLFSQLNQVSASSVPKFVGDSTDIYNADYNLEEQSVKLAISENEAIERPFQVRIKDGTVCITLLCFVFDQVWQLKRRYLNYIQKKNSYDT